MSSGPRGRETEYQDVSRQLADGFGWLRFTSPRLESAFRAAYIDQNVPRVRLALLAATLFYVAFGIAESVSRAPGIVDWSLTIRLVVLWPALAVGLWLTWYEPVRPRLPLVIMILALVLGAGTLANMAVLMDRGAPVPDEGILLFILFVYLLAGLRLPQAMVTCLVLTVAYFTVGALGGRGVDTLAYHGYFLLAANVVGAIGTYALEHQARRNFLNDRVMSYLADHDGLTGLQNFRAFRERLEMTWRQAVREQRPMALLILDVDYFKAYNDAYGHPAGDAALRAIARILEDAVRRPLDIAARQGGEEFALVWFDVEPERAHQLAQEVLDDIRNLSIPHAASPGGPVLTASAGLCAGQPSLPGHVGQWLQQADRALYGAKEAGRDRLMMAPPHPDGDAA